MSRGVRPPSPSPFHQTPPPSRRSREHVSLSLSLPLSECSLHICVISHNAVAQLLFFSPPKVDWTRRTVS